MNGRARIALGLMSGTSADGIDGVAVRFEGDRPTATLHAAHLPYPAPLRSRLLEMGEEHARLTPAQWAQADADVGLHYATLANELLEALGEDRRRVAAIGMHGQTVFHAQGVNSLQIGDPNRVSAGTGLPVVADIRRRDMAEGGQGAPLVPALHAALMTHPERDRLVLNLGGIANLTRLRVSAPPLGYDTGPANALMDAWCSLHTGAAWDADGAWASGGSADPALLEALLEEPYFSKPSPKSTGRGQFNLDWCRKRYPALDTLAPRDVQRSLAELTVESVARAVEAEDPDAGAELYVCGGGARNGSLMRLLAKRLAPRPIATTDALGVHPQHVEAIAFAWFALCRLDGRPAVPATLTGARKAAVLGALYAA